MTAPPTTTADLPRRSLTHLVFWYTSFAIVAALGNFAAQWLVFHLLPVRVALYPALVAGTGIGLLIKYSLDKRWIFFDLSRGVAAHSRRFTLYSAMGLITTAIFWGAEWSADALSGHTDWRYLGGAIGLAVGYVTKYHLDRRFVFGRGG